MERSLSTKKGVNPSLGEGTIAGGGTERVGSSHLAPGESGTHGPMVRMALRKRRAQVHFDDRVIRIYSIAKLVAFYPPLLARRASSVCMYFLSWFYLKLIRRHAHCLQCTTRLARPHSTHNHVNAFMHDVIQ